jgi:hypothetical protein
VGFCDLPAENKSNAGTARFRRKKRNKQICRIRDTVPSVINGHFEDLILGIPTDTHLSSGFDCRIRGVANEVNQYLFDLVRIKVPFDLLRGVHNHLDPRFESSNSTNQLPQFDLLQGRFRHTLRNKADASAASRRPVKSVSPSELISRITSPSESSRRAPRERSE